MTQKSEHTRKVVVVTSTRADWGLLSGIVKGLEARADVEVSVIATNMHLDERFGMTVREIEADGVEVAERVAMPSVATADADGSGVGQALGAAECMAGMARAFARLRPDIVLLLGDRYEMLAVASAATIMRIPIAHIAGGEISEGAIDDSIRHAITKLSVLHLTATEENRLRVVSMGEDERMVLNTGAIGVYNFINGDSADRAELEAFTGVPVTKRTLLVTYHPATLDSAPVGERFGALLDALDRFPENPVIFTYPNNDHDGQAIIAMILRYVDERNRRAGVAPAVAISSLGRRRYLGALRFVGAVVGNSSSGIVEVPSAGIPTVDIGIRQKGRLRGDSVIHSGDTADEIARAIGHALSEEGQRRASESENPYFRPDTLAMIVNAVAETPLDLLRHKKFIDHNLIPV